jgi:hypothetical protein
MAKCTPSRSRPGTGRSRGTREPSRQHDGVETLTQLLRAHVDAELQLDALGHELLHAALDDRLLDLEVGHSEAHQAARGLVAFVKHNAMACPAQLLRGSHARRAGADDGDRATGLVARRHRHDPPPSHAWLMIEFSICSIVTASPSRISSTHDASHGAGTAGP